MIADTAQDMLTDASLPTSPPLLSLVPTSGTPDTGVSSAPETHALSPAADLVTVPVVHLGDPAKHDASVPSIQVPEEAALAAAAAAAAAVAAAQGGTDVANQQDVAEQDVDGTDDLDSYLLAAAAASVHAQQQGNGDDQHKIKSEDSFDSTDTPMPNSVYTNGTSVNGSEENDVRTAIHDQCHRYIDDLSPYPLSIGKRTPGGCAEFLADAPSAARELEQLPLTEANIELGKTRCYWALLSADHSQAGRPTGEKLHFVYLDPVLQQHMAQQAQRMIGSDFYDYVHPEERERVSDDMQKIVDSRTLFGSVTRCRYSRVPRIRQLLGAVNPPRDPEADRYVEDDSFVAIDIVINWIGDGMLLCFFHAIIDKAAEDNDEQHKSDWTNWCGTPAGSFTLRQCDLIWKQVKAIPRETVAETGPVHVFQVIEAGGDGRVLLSWPPPRLFSRHIEPHLVTQSDTTVFHDGSYFADDFARLAQGVSITPSSSSLSDANTSCTRRFRAKHTLTTEGKVRSIESVLIPYGGIILACFHTTFQQPLPLPDPKLILQSRETLHAQPERRKAQDVVSHGSPPKRQRTEHPWTQSDAMNGAEAPPNAQASASAAKQTKPRAVSASTLPPPTLKSQDQVSATVNGFHAPPGTPGAKAANGHRSKPRSSKYTKSSVKNESGLAALANPSLMYTNAPTKPVAAHTNGTRPAAERATASPAQSNANGRSINAVASTPGDSPGSSPNKACTGCGKVNSPEWRRGPSGHKTLCNACGLRYARSLTRRKKKKGKDGQIEFIEPTGDPTVVPKSRGGGGGSLPGVHRKNSKKRKEEEAAKAAAAATVAATSGEAIPPTTSKSTSTSTEALITTPATVAASSATSPSTVSATQSPAPATPVAKLTPTCPSPPDPDESVPSKDDAASVAVKIEPSMDGDSIVALPPTTSGAEMSTSEATSESSVTNDPAHSMAVSIAIDAITHATSTVPSLDTDALPLPISNAINRAIAATMGSTDGATGTRGLITSQALSEVPGVTVPVLDNPASAELDPTVSAAALKTIESVVSEALFKQLVSPALPQPATVTETVTETENENSADTNANANANEVAVDTDSNIPANAHSTSTDSTPSTATTGLDLSHALTADAIRAAAQAAIAHGIAAEEPILSHTES